VSEETPAADFLWWCVICLVVGLVAVAALMLPGCGSAETTNAIIPDAGSDSFWPGSYPTVEASQPNGPPSDVNPWDNPVNSGTGWGGGGSPSPCGLPPSNPCVPKVQ
jgi:hypothetical protein